MNAHWLETGHLWGGGKNLSAKGKTDADGNIKLNVSGVPGVGAVKESFYANGVSRDEITKQFTSPVLAMNHASVTITLQKKIKPHPMFVRKIEGKSGRVPKIGEPCGFDLMAGEWVAPYGSGSVADFTVMMNCEIRGHFNYDFRWEVEFPNAGDGLIFCPVNRSIYKDELRLPREAPEKGYQSRLIYNYLWGDDKPKYAVLSEPKSPWEAARNSDDHNHYIRIRTKMSSDGKIISAIYGKIYGPFNLGFGAANDLNKPGDEEPQLKILYYLNSDSSRNLEWDTMNNLAGPDPERTIPKKP